MSQETIVVEAEFTKSTKNTHVFKATEDEAAIPSLYVNRSAFGAQPKRVRITVEVLE